MVGSSSKSSSFFSELKRRHVFRVAGVYCATAFVVVQVADIAAPALRLPEWTMTLVFVLALLGFPIAVALAWALEITPEGVRWTGDRTPEPSSPHTAPPPPQSAAAPAERARVAPANGNGKTRLIVLPFRVLRPDAETDFLAFSLPDAITSSLSGIGSLVVRSNLAALRYAGDAPDLAAIASQAEVDVVLTGTLLRVGEHLRVSAQLTDANDGTLIWSQPAQVSLGDLFHLQDQLARRIVDSLQLSLTTRERRLLQQDVPASARAYEFYLRANQVAYEAAQWTTARDLYLQSLELDPEYAPAWARLARCYRLIGKYAADAKTIEENLARSESAFKRALELNPELEIAHSLYAQLELELGRTQGAMVRLIRRASEGGSNADLFAGLVPACRFCGLLEASVAAHERARELDPEIVTSVPHTYMMLADYERAMAEYRTGDIGYLKSAALAMLGRNEEAITLLRRKTEEVDAASTIRPYLISLRALLEGKREECIAAMNQVTDKIRDGEALFYMARQFAHLGETTRAINELRRSVELGFFCYSTLTLDPWLDPLRSEPQFHEVLRLAEQHFRAAERAFSEAGGQTVLKSRTPQMNS